MSMITKTICKFFYEWFFYHLEFRFSHVCLVFLSKVHQDNCFSLDTSCLELLFLQWYNWTKHRNQIRKISKKRFLFLVRIHFLCCFMQFTKDELRMTDRPISVRGKAFLESENQFVVTLFRFSFIPTDIFEAAFSNFSANLELSDLKKFCIYFS